MKKLFLALLAIVGIFSLAACGGEDSTYEIAMITDAGDIDDESFNQGTWEGIVEYAEANDITHKYYKPAQVSDEAYLETIALAVEGGAKIVVAPGYLFEPAIYEAQTTYPDVNFVLIDGVPHPGDFATFEVADNTVSILFQEEQSGFLAGYAAVHDGYRNLGFMGGIAVPAVVRFGVGFVAGAYYAADELGAEISLPDNRFEYLGNFDASDEHKTKALAWYNEGTEIIFVAAGGAGSSVMSAAEDAEVVMIGVDVDQSSLSETVLTSAMKALAVVVQQALTDHFAGDFPGGETQIKSAANDGVALPMDTSRFETFDQAAYDAIYALLEAGSITVPTNDEELVTFLATLDVEPEPIVPEPVVLTVTEVLALEDGTDLLVEGVVIGTDDYKTFYVADATGVIAVYDGSQEYIGTLTVGDKVSISGARGEYNGLEQIASPVLEVLEVDVALPLPTVLLNDEDFTDLLPVQGRVVNVQGFVISDIASDNYGNITFTLTHPEDETVSIGFRYDSRSSNGEDFETLMESVVDGSVVDLTDAIMGWFNGPQLTPSQSLNLVVVSEPVEEETPTE